MKQRRVGESYSEENSHKIAVLAPMSHSCTLKRKLNSREAMPRPHALTQIQVVRVTIAKCAMIVDMTRNPPAGK